VLVTVPLPLPAEATWSTSGLSANVAVTLVSALIVTVQSPVARAGARPAGEGEPGAGFAVSVTELPYEKACEHIEPQEIPAGVWSRFRFRSPPKRPGAPQG